MQRKKKFISTLLIVMGMAIFLLYYKTGIVFFGNYDEVTQISNAKIIDYQDYIRHGNYEVILLTSSLILFIGGVILFIASVKADRNKSLLR